MIKKTGLFLLTLFALCAFNEAGAQVRLKIDSAFSIYLTPDTVQFGNSYTDSVVIVNVDSVDFIGTITLGASVNGIIDPVVTDTTQSGISASLDTTVIAAGGSVRKFVHFKFNNPVFLASPSVVVIWPISTNANITNVDSVSRTFIIEGISPATNLSLNNLKVYIKENELMVQTDNQIWLKRVRIYAVSGTLAEDIAIDGNTAIVPVGMLQSGLYLAEITLADNSRKVFKVIKTGN
ncbi:MAG TPA: hypothetical protein VG603_16685 [Chitinophagales bacterium]|nr:hypothetical protein [Chitinophagales bacterium]